MLKSSWQHPWNNGEIFVGRDGRMEEIRMEVGRVGVDCVEFWAWHCCCVVVGPDNKYVVCKGGGLLCGVLGLPLLFCSGGSSRIGAGVSHCGYPSGGFCGAGVERWDQQVAFGVVLAAFGFWVLAAFCGRELLAVAIPTLIHIVFLLSLACPCLWNDDIKSEHAHKRHTRVGGGGEHAKWLHNYNFPSYPLIIHITWTRGLISWKCMASVGSPIKPYMFRPYLITQKTL